MHSWLLHVTATWFCLCCLHVAMFQIIILHYLRKKSTLPQWMVCWKCSWEGGWGLWKAAQEGGVGPEKSFSGVNFNCNLDWSGIWLEEPLLGWKKLYSRGEVILLLLVLLQTKHVNNDLSRPKLPSPDSDLSVKDNLLNETDITFLVMAVNE